MDLKELRRLPLPKLRDLAKQETDLKGVIGMEKEALIEAIAKAKGISYETMPKDVTAIHSIKHEIKDLRKHKAELLSSSPDRKKLTKIQRKVKQLKRLTRKLAHETKMAPRPTETAPSSPPPSAPSSTPSENPPAAAG